VEEGIWSIPKWPRSLNPALHASTKKKNMKSFSVCCESIQGKDDKR